jgi:hypothetical protein
MLVCIVCRMVRPPCNHEKFSITHRWRAPKKTNDKAWRMVANGDYWWDKRHLDRTADKYIWHPAANGLEKMFGQASKAIRRRRNEKASDPLAYRLELERRKKLMEERRRRFHEEGNSGN